MAAVRFVLCLAPALLLAFTSSAHAASLLVLRADGTTAHRADPGVAAVDRTARPAPRAHLKERAATHTLARAAAKKKPKKPKRTVTRELRRLYDTGAIDVATYEARRADYTSFKAA